LSQTHSAEKATDDRGLKMKNSVMIQLKNLRDLLFGLHLNLFQNPSLATSFCNSLVAGVEHKGNGYLKLHRGLFVQGLKVLTLGDPEFVGFQLTKNGYPRYYDEIFSELYSIGASVESSRLPVNWKDYIDPCSGAISGNMPTYLPSLNQKTISRLKTILTLLNWPKFVKLDLSEIKKSEILHDFKVKMTSWKEGDSEYNSGLVADGLVRFLPNMCAYKGYEQDLEGTRVPFTKLMLSARTYKGRPDTVGKLPECVAYMSHGMVNPIYIDKTPLGKATVLSEKAGKNRIIVGYNGLVNAHGVGAYLRRILDNNPNDCSKDQTIGHNHLKSFSAKGYTIASMDLSEFTDGLTSTVLYPFLDSLGIHDFMGVINAPIEVGGEIIKPVRPMMGLKGTFELASIIHHCVTKSSNMSNYYICGDDLVAVGGNLDSYVRTWSNLGIQVNQTKSIVAEGLGTFCGKTYFWGVDISPVRIPLSTITDCEDELELYTVCGSTVSNASGLTPGARKVIGSKVVRLMASKRNLKGRKIHKSLPFKLGGLGLDRDKPLLSVLSNDALSICSVPVEKPLPDAHITRRWFPLVDDEEVRLFYFLPLLLVSGFYTRSKKRTTVLRKRSYRSLLSVLEYFYSIGEFAPA
jgi:hypothetical protein